MLIWGCPKIRGTSLGVPILRTVVFWGLYWGPLNLGHYHIPQYTKILIARIPGKVPLILGKPYMGTYIGISIGVHSQGTFFRQLELRNGFRYENEVCYPSSVACPATCKEDEQRCYITATWAASEGCFTHIYTYIYIIGYCPHPVTVYIRGPIKGYI